jgi:hypothetical protein
MERKPVSVAFWSRGKRGREEGRLAAPPVLPGEPSDEELLAAVAQRIVGMSLAVPAVFFLESTKPLSFVGSQALVFLQPFVEAFLSVRNYERLAALLEDRANIERLIQRLETLDEEARSQERLRRGREKEARAARRAGGREKGPGSPPCPSHHEPREG